ATAPGEQEIATKTSAARAVRTGSSVTTWRSLPRRAGPDIAVFDRSDTDPDEEVEHAATRSEEREAQAPVRAHQAERERSRALVQGRGPHRRSDHQQDPAQEGRNEGVAQAEEV